MQTIEIILIDVIPFIIKVMSELLFASCSDTPGCHVETALIKVAPWNRLKHKKIQYAREGHPEII